MTNKIESPNFVPCTLLRARFKTQELELNFIL